MGAINAIADAVRGAVYDIRYSGIVCSSRGWHCNQCRDGALSDMPLTDGHIHNHDVHASRLRVKRDPQFNE